jgi:hypothetical protein
MAIGVTGATWRLVKKQPLAAVTLRYNFCNKLGDLPATDDPDGVVQI